MKRVNIDCSKIKSWDSFHDIFSIEFGFPDFYGRNLDAWIDCMSDINDPDSGMTKITCDKNDFILLELDNVSNLKKDFFEIYEAIIECAAFVNWRCVEVGGSPPLMLSFHF